MNAACNQHPTRFATATCVECERPICAECTQTVANRSVCSLCVEAIRVRVASGLNALGSAQSSSSIPVNVPRATSGIPMSVPRSNPSAPPPAYGGPGALNTPSAPQPGGAAPYQQTSGAAPLLGGSYAPVAPALDSTQPYPPAPQVQPLYTPPGAQPAAPAPYGQPTTTAYNPSAGYSQSANQQLPPQYVAEGGPNITLAVIVGVIMVILVGGGCGAASIAIGMRLPLLSILVGLIVGHAVKAAAKIPSHAVGIIAGVCSLLTCSLTYGMLMLMTTYQPSAIALLLLFYATWRGYRIGSGESSW